MAGTLTHAAIVSAFAVAACVGQWILAAAPKHLPREVSLEVILPRDGGKAPMEYDEAADKLRLQLRIDDSGRLRRWLWGIEVRVDEELMTAIHAHRSSRWDIPVGIDALGDVSWREIVRTIALCRNHGYRVSFMAPLEVR